MAAQSGVVIPVIKNKHSLFRLTGAIISSRLRILAPRPAKHIAVCQKHVEQQLDEIFGVMFQSEQEPSIFA
jgi:hypothetical protein